MTVRLGVTHSTTSTVFWGLDQNRFFTSLREENNEGCERPDQIDAWVSAYRSRGDQRLFIVVAGGSEQHLLDCLRAQLLDAIFVCTPDVLFLEAVGADVVDRGWHDGLAPLDANEVLVNALG